MIDPLSLIVHGAAGRMGQRVVALAADDPHLRLVAAIEQSGHPALGQDAMQMAGCKGSKLPLASEWPPSAEVVRASCVLRFEATCVRPLRLRARLK